MTYANVRVPPIPDSSGGAALWDSAAEGEVRVGSSANWGITAITGAQRRRSLLAVTEL